MRHKESLQYIVQFDFLKWHDNDPTFGHQIPDYDSLAPNQLARVIKKYLE